MKSLILEILLSIIFFIFFVIGFYIIYRQVALIRKGEFRNRDRLQCTIYGFIFSLSVMIVVALAFTFITKTEDFWGGATPPDLNPLFLLIPFTFCLIYITFYPLIDFLFIALSKESDEGLSPFHKFISLKVINRFKSKSVAMIISVFFYLLVFIIPPIIFTLIGLPFIMIWITWTLIYPLMILTFYGSKGYIAGVSNVYYHIPHISRSIFINFEDPKRGAKQFFSNPGPYLILGLMLFVFVWAWISLFQTIAFFFIGLQVEDPKLAISTMSSVFVFVTLFFGIIGYFTRFWGRKVKYRGIDIYFAAYLMASIGINVLINFLIVNKNKLESTFNSWNLTIQIIPSYLLFAWAAVIEEIVLIIFTTYFFFNRNSNFIKNIRKSKITECGQVFDPIPLFNFIKNRDPEIRKYAEETLLLMFERIPLKDDVNLDEWKFKTSILDGVCDNHTTSRRICFQVLKQLENDVPNITVPWIIESLDSPNYEKNIPILKSLLKLDLDLLSKIPIEKILNLLNDTEWRMKLLGLQLYSRLCKKDNDLISKLNFKKYINDPIDKIQIEILNIFSESSLSLPYSIVIEKIFHSNNEVRAAAINNLKNISIDGFKEEIFSKIIPLMENPSSLVRASIFDIIARIGKFKKNKIPILPLLEGLVDFNKDVRNSSVLSLERYYKEESSLLDLDEIIKKIDPKNPDTLISIITLLGRLWKHNPKKILTNLLIFIKFENKQLRIIISNILIERYNENPDLIIQQLIKIPDVSGYITKGIIAETLIKIGKADPISVIPTLIQFLENQNIDIKLNTLSSLEGLVEQFPRDTGMRPVLNIFTNEKNKQLKKEASKLISTVAKKIPKFIETLIPEFIQSADAQDTSVRVILFKALLEIASKSPEIIPISSIINFLSDQDSFIRETSTKILGFIGYKNSSVVIDTLLKNSLTDEDWIVREATVSSLGKIINHVEDKEKIIQKLGSLLNDEQNWVRWSAMNILSDIKEVNDSHIPFNILYNNLISTDPKVREASAGLIGIYSNQIEIIFDKIIVLLEDESKEVRERMINTFVKIIQEISLNRILTKLLQNLSDEGSLETQRSIALILSRTAKYESENIKKRIVSLLKIRCEMSQDPIICNCLQTIKER